MIYFYTAYFLQIFVILYYMLNPEKRNPEPKTLAPFTLYSLLVDFFSKPSEVISLVIFLLQVIGLFTEAQFYIMLLWIVMILHILQINKYKAKKHQKSLWIAYGITRIMIILSMIYGSSVYVGYMH